MSNKETTYAIVKIGGLDFTAKTFESVKGLHQCSFTDMRQSLDGTLGLVKWTGTAKEMPASIAPYVVSVFTYDEIQLELAKPTWTRGPVQTKKEASEFLNDSLFLKVALEDAQHVPEDIEIPVTFWKRYGWYIAGAAASAAAYAHFGLHWY